MSNVKKEDRVDGTVIRKLNRLGLGLRAIGAILGCHAATVAGRLKEMGEEPIDTRQNFMEDIYNALSSDEREWLADNLYSMGIPVKEFVLRIIKEAFSNAPATPSAAPTPLPVSSPPTEDSGPDLSNPEAWNKLFEDLKQPMVTNQE